VLCAALAETLRLRQGSRFTTYKTCVWEVLRSDDHAGNALVAANGEMVFRMGRLTQMCRTSGSLLFLPACLVVGALLAAPIDLLWAQTPSSVPLTTQKPQQEDTADSAESIMPSPQEPGRSQPTRSEGSPRETTMSATNRVVDIGFGILGGGTMGPTPYKPLRYDEDWSYLKDPTRRTDFWDPIKYIPFGGRDDVYLSIGGEARIRYEFFRNESLGSAPANHDGKNDYALQRYMLHADLHVGSRVRFFGEMWSGIESGRIGGPRPDIDKDSFDVHQAFVDIVLPLGNTDTLTWRVGRQEMTYGGRRLIDVRGAQTLRRSFDAARFLLRVGEWSVDGFFSKPVRNQPNVFDNSSDSNRTLWGLYAVHPLAFLPDGHVDLYYLGFEDQEGRFDQGTAYELRHTLGTRLWGQPLPWEYNFEFLWQFGSFGSGTIQAWAVATATYYNFDRLPLRPRLGLAADITSGDRDPKSANLQTYNPLFPTGAFFNLQDPAGPQNVMHLHPFLDVHLTESLTATADWGFWWRQSPDDAVYRISGAPFRSGQQSQSLYVGNSPAVTVTWRATSHLTLLAGYVHFFSGTFFQETPPDKDVDYFTTWMTYMF